MGQPLGRYVGNALEVEECLEILRCEPSSADYLDTIDLSLDLAGAMIWLGQSAMTFKEGREIAQQILNSGKAFELFEKVVKVQGGDLAKLPKAKHTKAFLSTKSGYLSSFDTEKIGIAALVMGAGRQKFSDVIDPVAGLKFHKKLGDPVEINEPLVTLYASDTALFERAEEILHTSIQIGEASLNVPPLVAEQLFNIHSTETYEKLKCID